jgi:aminocarboxymuconate-semialdehyde decarboxylase
VRPEGPAAIPRPPRDYARLLYFDSLTLSQVNLRFLVEQFGADHVMIGSDYPFDMGSDDPVAALAEANLPPTAREQIESTTAVRFLGL